MGPQAGPKPHPTAKSSAPSLSPDDWIWVLETFRRATRRRASPGEFVQMLAANESLFYPILEPYGFRGSWTTDQAYLDDFDAAVRKWGKSFSYSLKFGSPEFGPPSQGAPPKEQSPEERRYEQAQFLLFDMNRHGYRRGQVNRALESAGLLDDLKSHGFETERDVSFANHEAYQLRAIEALNEFIYRYRSAHGLGVEASAGVPTEGENVEFYRAWLEGLGYVTSSFVGAEFAAAASIFTNDPKKITAAAGFGASLEAVIGAMYGGSRGSYSPEVEVGPRDIPAVVAAGRSSGTPRIDPVIDPAKVGAPPVRERIPTPDPVLQDPVPAASRATEPDVPPPPSPVKQPPAPAGKTPDTDVGAPPKQEAPPAPAIAPVEPVLKELKPARSTSRKNPPIDSKRQVRAKNRREQTKAELQAASREKASAEHELLSAQARVRDVIARRIPIVPQRLESESTAIFGEKDWEARLALVEEIRASRADWSADERAWLDQQVELLDAQLDVKAAQEGHKTQEEIVRDATILGPVRDQEVARASKSVADLIRSRGPNYRAVGNQVNYDEIMGKEAWDQLKAGRTKDAHALALNTDHIIPVREIRDEVVNSGLLELHDKASPAVKEQIEKAIQGLGDERSNLVRMEKVANQEWKSDRSWVEVPYGRVASLYTRDMVRNQGVTEARLRLYYKQVIQTLVTRFSK